MIPTFSLRQRKLWCSAYSGALNTLRTVVFGRELRRNIQSQALKYIQWDGNRNTGSQLTFPHSLYCLQSSLSCKHSRFREWWAPTLPRPPGLHQLSLQCWGHLTTTNHHPAIFLRQRQYSTSTKMTFHMCPMQTAKVPRNYELFPLWKDSDSFHSTESFSSGLTKEGKLANFPPLLPCV